MNDTIMLVLLIAVTISHIIFVLHKTIKDNQKFGDVILSRNEDGSPYIHFLFYNDYETTYEVLQKLKKVSFKVKMEKENENE